MNNNIEIYEKWMRYAIIEGVKALNNGEVPIGAVIVSQNKIIGRGYNQVESLNDATAHAEVLAISAASNTLDNWRLNECEIYVTKEPCVMCAGAIINSRIRRVVFGSYDDKKGACASLYQICGDKRLGSGTSVNGGVMEKECTSILKEFFSLKRHS